MSKSQLQNSSKWKAVESARRAIDKQFGKGALMLLGEGGPSEGIEVIPSGSLSLDLALGIGGFPRGRLVEVFGPESSGKTTMTLHAIAEAQRAGGVAAFIDAEHALDVRYAQALGVRPESLYISQPDHGEQALEIAEMLARSGGVDLIVVDSVAALVPRAEIEGEMGDTHVGLQARLMSQAMRKLTAVAARQGCTLMFINQIRMKIGVMFGSPETTTGGNALKFYSSVRLDVRRCGVIKEGDKAAGNRVRIKVVKNKVAPPFREAELEMRFGAGVNRQAELLDLGVANGEIERSGTWYSMGKTRLGQGRAQAMVWLAAEENAAAVAKLEDAVREKAGMVPRAAEKAA